MNGLNKSQITSPSSTNKKENVDSIDQGLNENEGFKKKNEMLARRNEELEKELRRAKDEIKGLEDELKKYAKFEESVQNIARPIVDQVVDDFQNVWAQRIAMQVEENIRQKGLKTK